jgi:hypothetical protein
MLECALNGDDIASLCDQPGRIEMVGIVQTMPTGRVIRRIEPARCGDRVHIDVKKLGKIPAGGGWRMLGRAAGKRNTWADKSSGTQSKYRNPLHGYHYLHTGIDGHSRLACSELLTDECTGSSLREIVREF